MGKEKTYIASFSGGKDSMATIILAHEHKEPLDLIIFAEVMFDKEISGELPEHIQFIKEKAIPTFEKWGYKTEILHSEKTYMDCFNHIVKNSKVEERNGKKAGFPMAGKCAINRGCKLKPINNFIRQYDQENLRQYIGIAADEKKRLERLKGTNRISLLEKYGYTEKMCFELCEDYGLLSPIYDFTKRGGCWFCPNARYFELKQLRTHHRNLWEKLLDLENQDNLVGEIWNGLTGRRMKDTEDMFFWEEAQMDIFEYLELIEDKPDTTGGEII